MADNEQLEARRELAKKLAAHARAVLKRQPDREGWALVFGRYDRNGDGRLTAAELATWLEDADVGNWLTRAMWVDGIMRRVDDSGDAAISLDELMGAISRGLVDPDFLSDGMKRVDEFARKELTPPSLSLGIDSGALVLLAIGALYLMSQRS